MNNHLWALNITCISLTIGTIVYLMLFNIKPPIKERLSTQSIQKTEDSNTNVDLKIIAEQNIFGVTEQATPNQKHEEGKKAYQSSISIQIPYIPQPPSPVKSKVKQEPSTQPLPPLTLKMTGVILSSDPKKNRVFIENVRTKEENLYEIGDIVEDGQIIFIGKDQTIFIRSNGQQETIYLYNADTSNKTETKIWKNIIKQIDQFNFSINQRLFIENIPTLGHLLEELDLVTTLEGGIPIGCRVEAVSPNSLGAALGLQAGDIIKNINNESTSSSENRIKIYKSIISKKEESQIITLDIIREKNKFTKITYNIAPTELEFKQKKKRGILSSGDSNIDTRTLQKSPEYKESSNALQKFNENRMAFGSKNQVISRGVDYDH